MSVSLLTPATLVTPIELPRAQLPVPVAKVEDVKRELLSTRAELALQRRELDVLKGDSPRQVGYARLLRTANWIRRAQLDTLNAFGSLAFMAGVVGAFAGVVSGGATDSAIAGWSAFFGCFSVGAAISPVSAGIVALANRARVAPPVRMVELAEIAAPLERFGRAEGAVKAQIAEGLAAMRTTLEAKEILSPEALRALNAAATEAGGIEGSAVARQRLFTQLARLLAEPIDSSLVENAKYALSQLPQDERARVAQAAYELIFSDRKRVARTPYATRNALHELLTNAMATGNKAT